METGVPARLTPAEGRKFGLTVGGAFLVLASLFHFWRHNEPVATVTGALGTVLVVAAAVVPTHLGKVQRAWMGLAHLISRVTTPILMGLVFFVVMTPIGLVMRMFGHRPLARRTEDGSYFNSRPAGPQRRSNLSRQF